MRLHLACLLSCFPIQSAPQGFTCDRVSASLCVSDCTSGLEHVSERHMCTCHSSSLPPPPPPPPPSLSLPTSSSPQLSPIDFPELSTGHTASEKARADNMQQTAMSTAVTRCRITNKNENTCKHMRAGRSCSFCFRMHAGLSGNTLTCTELCLLECSSSSPSP